MKRNPYVTKRPATSRCRKVPHQDDATGTKDITSLRNTKQMASHAITSTILHHPDTSYTLETTDKRSQWPTTHYPSPLFHLSHHYFPFHHSHHQQNRGTRCFLQSEGTILLRRCCEKIQKIHKPLISGSGFDFSTNLFYDPIMAKVERLRWSTFFQHLFQPAIIAIVQEFYANFIEAQDRKVFVRGIFIDASPIAIGDFHRTPRYTS
ncbi:hypothetical protein GOBAR_AA22921 [Gossypium barbadense]|uniref:Uncharacterized protein n=1 Tax=Gossypium barbadense TaxID=3634 RepID=A0A2P5X330_GOSBA|nr:hypothetical protein GOBAR_AA22921 [Gossypium barbadense]